MKVKLIGAMDYSKIAKQLKKQGVENITEIIEYMRNMEKASRAIKVATAGRLSRFQGDVFQVLGLSESKTLEQNTNFIKRVTEMGHNSITDHDYLVFAIKDVSPVIEQTIIAERFSSFTIKSRREVDFTHAGFYVPDFHDEDGNIIKKNMELQEEYKKQMNGLFQSYNIIANSGIPKEDARFVLPYSFYSNIIMGVDAHTLKDMIIKFTKTHLSKIQELREFGERLYEIAKENIPYIIDEIDSTPLVLEDPVSEYLNSKIQPAGYQILDKPELINYTNDIDNTICVAALMRRYGYDYEHAYQVLIEAEKVNPNFKEELIKKITFEGDKSELSHVNFEFQIPLSFAVLTHLTRHRTHQMLIPEFAPNIDLTQYKVPPKIKNSDYAENFDRIFKENLEAYLKMKELGIREEDLVYYTLSGNLVNVVSNMDGKTLEHILGLRECNKAQWETRNMAVGMHNEIRTIEDAKIFSSVLGPTCETKGICNEGKECCGKVYALQRKNK